MNDNTIESIEWHKDQLVKLLSDDLNFGKVESEIDSILEKAKMKKKVQVRRGGKTFWREQEVGRSDDKEGSKVGSKKKPVDTWIQRSNWSQDDEDRFFAGLSRKEHNDLIRNTFKESVDGLSDMKEQYEQDAEYAKELYNKKYNTNWDTESN